MRLYFLLFGLGVVVGCVIMALLSRSKAIGNLCLDDSAVGCVPYLALKHTTDLDVIKQKEYVKLRVVIVKDRSQK